MTTKQEWLFRANYLQMQARHLRERAAAMVIEAEHHEHQASSCHYIADQIPSVVIPAQNIHEEIL